MEYCTVSDVKALAGITVATYDAVIGKIIKRVSARINNYCRRDFAREEITGEIQAANYNQYLYLNKYPVIEITEVKLNGGVLTINQDYFCNDTDKKAGRLYKPTGWSGGYYERGGLATGDIVSGARAIEVSYIAGYYLPGSEDYSEDASDSLPLAISTAAEAEAAKGIREYLGKSENLSSITQGGLSYSFFKNDDKNSGGLSADTQAALSGFISRRI